MGLHGELHLSFVLPLRPVVTLPTKLEAGSTPASVCNSLQIQLRTDLVFHPGNCHGLDMGLKKQMPFYDLA